MIGVVKKQPAQMASWKTITLEQLLAKMGTGAETKTLPRGFPLHDHEASFICCFAFNLL